MGELYLQLHAWGNNRALIGLNSSIHTPRDGSWEIKEAFEFGNIAMCGYEKQYSLETVSRSLFWEVM